MIYERGNKSFSLHQPLIHPHQLCHTAGLCGGAHRETIGCHHSFIIGLVGTAQLHRHGYLVVQVCQAAVGVQCTGVQNALGCLFNFRLLLLCRGGPGEVVVNDVLGIAVVTFNSSTDGPHPGHMDIRSENTKMIGCCIWNDLNCIVYDNFRGYKAKWDIFSSFGRVTWNNYIITVWMTYFLKKRGL